MEDDMLYLRSQIGVRALDHKALLRSAIGLVSSAGISLSEYQSMRRESPHPAAYDVETVIRHALREAGCQLYSIDSVVAARDVEDDVMVLGDIIAYSRKA